MQHTERVTAVIEREGDGFIALCSELDMARQGGTIEEARAILEEVLGWTPITGGGHRPRVRATLGYSSWVRICAGVSRRCADRNRLQPRRRFELPRCSSSVQSVVSERRPG